MISQYSTLCPLTVCLVICLSLTSRIVILLMGKSYALLACDPSTSTMNIIGVLKILGEMNEWAIFYKMDIYKSSTQSSIQCCQVKSHWTEKTSPTPLDPLTYKGTVSAGNRRPGAQCFHIRISGPHISGTFPSSLEWKLETYLEITLVSGIREDGRMIGRTQAGESLFRSHQHCTFSSLDTTTLTLTWKDRKSDFPVCHPFPFCKYTEWTEPCWGENDDILLRRKLKHGKINSFAQGYHELCVLTVLHQTDTPLSTH